MQLASFTCETRVKVRLTNCSTSWPWYDVLSNAILATTSLFTLFKVITRCSNQRVQRVTRKLFQRIQKTGRLLTMPRCLYMDSNEISVSPFIYETGGFAHVRKSKYHGNFVAVKYLRRELDDEHRRVIYHVPAKYSMLIYYSASFTRLCCGRASNIRGYYRYLVSLIIVN